MSRLGLFVGLIVLLAGCAASSEPPGSIQASPGAPASAGVEPTADAAPSSHATAAPKSKPIVLKGRGSRKTKPFTMRAPARVDLAFSGSGNFISGIVPVGGGTFDGAQLSNTIGRTKLTTYVYGTELDGVRCYANVIATSGGWTITIRPGVPSALSAPASFSGKWGMNTRLVHLSGDFTVTDAHAGAGNFIVQLVPADGSLFGGDSIANEIGRVNDRTEAYGLDGDYYFNVTADGSWTIKIAPQG